MTPESRRARAGAIRAEADLAESSLEAAAVRVHGMPEGKDRDSAMEEIQEARDVLGVARSGASAGAATGDDRTLDEVEAVVSDLHRWAEGFPSRR